jgi:hypothetical protein
MVAGLLPWQCGFVLRPIMVVSTAVKQLLRQSKGAGSKPHLSAVGPGIGQHCSSFLNVACKPCMLFCVFVASSFILWPL